MSASERASGNISSTIAAVPKSYFCNHCNCSFRIELSPNTLCPLCNDGFLEEVISDDQNPTGMLDSIAGLLGGPSGISTTAVDLQNPKNFSNILGSESMTGPDEFNPFLFLLNHLENLRASGANVQSRRLRQPAAKSAVEKLATIKSGKEVLGSDEPDYENRGPGSGKSGSSGGGGSSSGTDGWGGQGGREASDGQK